MISMRETTFEEEEDWSHPEVNMAAIRIMRNENDFVDIPCPYTPPELIFEMLERIGDAPVKRVLVLYTLEMAIILKEIGWDVTVATMQRSDLTERMAQEIGCNYTTLEEVENAMRDKGKKFNLVMGNPPYQNKHEKDVESGRKVGNKLWYQFMFQAKDLVEKDGIVAMVTPTQWMGGGVQMRKGKLGVIADIFASNQVLFAKVANVTEEHFKGVGVNIGYSIWKNCAPSKATSVEMKDGAVDVDFRKTSLLSPNPTVMSQRIVSKTLGGNFPKWDDGYYFNAFKPSNNISDKEVTHWVMGSDVTGNLVTEKYKETRNKKVGYKKILFKLNTHYWQPHLSEKNVNVATVGYALKVDDNTTYEGFKSVFYGRLYTYLCYNLQIKQNAFMKTNLVRNLPKMDMSRVWTDEEIYDYFGLTQKEKDYVDAETNT